MRIGKVISTAKEKGILMIKILGLGKSDIRTLLGSSSFGIDSNPTVNYRAVYVDTEDKRDKVCVGYINKKAIANSGELRLYSEKSDGSDSFFIYLKSDGKCHLGGDSDNLVRYSKLEEALQNFKTTLSAQLTAALPTLTWTPANTEACILDLTLSKINEIKTL